MAYIEIPLSLKGKSQAVSTDKETAGTSGYLSNVRPRDVLEGKLRIGQRPGLKKAYAQQIGGQASPVVLLLSVTKVT
jgi:hypothetical protein